MNYISVAFEMSLVSIEPHTQMCEIQRIQLDELNPIDWACLGQDVALLVKNGFGISLPVVEKNTVLTSGDKICFIGKCYARNCSTPEYIILGCEVKKTFIKGG